MTTHRCRGYVWLEHSLGFCECIFKFTSSVALVLIANDVVSGRVERWRRKFSDWDRKASSYPPFVIRGLVAAPYSGSCVER